MMVDYCMLNQMVISTSTAVPHVIFLLEQISISSNTGYTTIGLAKAFSLYLSTRPIRSNLLPAGNVSNTPLLFCLSGISAL